MDTLCQSKKPKLTRASCEPYMVSSRDDCGTQVEDCHQKTRARWTRKDYRPLSWLGQEEQEDDVYDSEYGLNALGKPSPGARLIEAIVGSGAVNSVTPPGIFDAKVLPSEMSKAGRKYRGPDGSRIPNFGQQEVAFATDEGHKCGLTMQVADVERPLVAVSHLSEAGNDVSLGKNGGKIVNLKTKRTIAVARKGNLYVLRMWVNAKEGVESGKGAASGFTRLGRS